MFEGFKMNFLERVKFRIAAVVVKKRRGKERIFSELLEILSVRNIVNCDWI